MNQEEVRMIFDGGAPVLIFSSDAELGVKEVECVDGYPCETEELDGESSEYHVVYRGGSGDLYPGPYEFTPTENTQTAQISDMVASQNIIINPIPTNYGRITKVGAVIVIT